MLITDYQSKLLAYELTKRCASDSEEKLAATVAGAQVDLNPHQVDAALFAFESPLSKGAILPTGFGSTTKSTVAEPRSESANGSSDSVSRSVISVVAETRQQQIRQTLAKRNAHYYEAEAQKLDGWADDLKVGLEREIKEMDRLIKEARRDAATALTLEEKLARQKQIKTVEAPRNDKRRSLFDSQDAIDQQREDLIGKIEGKLQQQTSKASLFSIRWALK